MKRLLTILILLSFCFIAKSQYVVPRGYPIKNMSYYNFAAPGGFVLIDSLIMTRSHDTTMKPLYPSLMYWQNTGVDSAWWQWDMVRWSKIGSGGGSGGVTTFFALTDVDSSGIQDGYIPYYDATSGNILFQSQGEVATGNVYYAIDSTNTPPGVPTTGDVYMVGGAGTGAWSGHNYDIATWNGASWDFTDPTTGDIAVVASTKKSYKYNGSTWVITGGIPLLVGGNNLNTFLEFGALSNNGAALITNGLRRIVVSNGGAISFNRGSNAYTFPSSNSAGVLTNNGSGTLTWSAASSGTVTSVGLTMPTGFSVANSPVTTSGTLAVTTTLNGILKGDGSGFGTVTVGSGLSYDGTTLSSTVSGGLTTADNGLTANTATNVRLGGSLVANTTVDGAFTLTLSPSRVIINVADSVQVAASNDIGITSLGTLRNTAATITSKAATATFGSNTKSIFHYETGVGDSIALELKSTGARWVGINTFSTSTTAYKPLQQDTVTGFMIRKLIDVSSSSQITGTLAVGNGGTGQTSFTDGQLLIGNTTGNTLTKATLTAGTGISITNGSGSITIATSGTSVWTRGALPSASATTNIVYPTTQTDSVFIGVSSSGLTSNKPRALFEVNGTAEITGVLTTQTNASFAAAGFIINSSGKIAINNSTVTSGWSISQQNWAGTGGFILVTGNANSATVGVAIRPNLTATTAVSTEYVGFQSQLTQTNASNIVNTGIKQVDLQFAVGSTSATQLPYYYGVNVAAVTVSSGSQQITNNYGIYVGGVAGSTDVTGTALYNVFLDSSNANTYSGASAFGIFQRTNVANTIKNNFQSNLLVGTGTQDASAALEVISTTQGVLMPRMTATQASAITGVNGLIVYVTDTNGTFTSAGFWGYQAGAWAKL